LIYINFLTYPNVGSVVSSLCVNIISPTEYNCLLTHNQGDLHLY